MPNDAGLCSAFELKGFWQLELLTFIRARVELRQHARTDTFDLRREQVQYH